MTEDSPQTAPDRKGGLGPWRVLIIGVMLTGALLLAAGGMLVAGYAWVGWQFTKDGPHADDAIVMIERGDGLIAISETLEAEGLIADARIFRFKIQFDEGDRGLRAGEYAIPGRASMAEIYDILREGDPIQHAVRIPEGLTMAMVERIVANHPMLSGEIETLPEEGGILPETYMVDRGTPRQQVLDRLAADRDDLLDELWDGRDPDLPYDTREEATILASIVEKETAVADERPLVASVFVNRLRRGMRLQSDPTIIYGVTGGEPLGRGIRRSELDDETNPYNTYFVDGLPPTPIANPGRESIRAVLNPPESDYLYFVADGQGGHAFAETLNEHNRNVANWRRIERERAAAAREGEG